MNSITLNIWLQHNKSIHDMFIRDILLIQLDYKGYSQTCKRRHLYANYSICSGNICILEYEATWYFSLNMIYLDIHQWPWKYNLFLQNRNENLHYIHANHFWSKINLFRSFQFELIIHKCISNDCIFHLHAMNMPYALCSIEIGRIITMAEWK